LTLLLFKLDLGFGAGPGAGLCLAAAEAVLLRGGLGRNVGGVRGIVHPSAGLTAATAGLSRICGLSGAGTALARGRGGGGIGVFVRVGVGNRCCCGGSAVSHGGISHRVIIVVIFIIGIVVGIAISHGSRCSRSLRCQALLARSIVADGLFILLLDRLWRKDVARGGKGPLGEGVEAFTSADENKEI
jgi:hypothetical protein